MLSTVIATVPALVRRLSTCGLMIPAYYIKADMAHQLNGVNSELPEPLKYQ